MRKRAFTIQVYTFRIDSPLAEMPIRFNSPAILAEIYVEALLIDEELADQVWEALDKGRLSEF